MKPGVASFAKTDAFVSFPVIYWFVELDESFELAINDWD